MGWVSARGGPNARPRFPHDEPPRLPAVRISNVDARGGPQKLDHSLSEKSALLPTQEQSNEGEADEAQPRVQGEGGAGGAARGGDRARVGAPVRRPPGADLRVEEAS